MTRDEVGILKRNMCLVFDTPQGKDVMKYLEKIGSWYPTVMDSNDTNAIVARDANRRLIGTIKTIMELEPEQIYTLMGGE
jgi:hypothetical protein